ncbi:MAG: periplasmic heavy metal sensor [Myxococcales bacterium]|nr:periplasmic heavy metal sensor [Myxococcales bacterium]
MRTITFPTFVRPPLRIAFITTILLGLVCGPIIHAEAHDHGRRGHRLHHGKRHGGMGGHLLHMFAKLDLTETQEQELREIQAELKQTRKDLHSGMRQDLDSVTAELSGTAPNREQLLSMIDNRITHMRTLARETLNKALDFQATLSNEQKEELAKLLTRRAERLKDRLKDRSPPKQ